MLRAILGKSSERSETSTSQTSRRKDEVDRPASRHRSESIVSSNSARKPPQGDDRDRGFNPNSTSYSSTSRTAYPGTASASVASSYATASSNQADQPFIPPGLVRNASLADQMPKPKSGRDDQWRESGRERRVERRRERSTSRERQTDYKERSRSRDREGKKRSKKEKRENRESDRGMDRGISRSGDSYTGDQGTVRAGDYSAQASGSFNAQVGSSGFTQFPGQYDGGMPAFAPGPLPSAANMSSYVPDQFPGQFPSQSTAPYRPPVAATEGGPGLAAEYYGDAGESVAHQPGVRPQAPSLIVGAEPHLQAASLISAPPVEPSVTGNVGAAASFFSGTDNYQSLSSIKPPKPGKQSKPEKPSKANKISGSAVVAGSAALGYATANSGSSSVNQGTGGSHSTSFYQQGSNVPAPSAAGYSPSTATQANSHHSSSAPVIPTLGAAAAGAAAGYMMGHHSSSQYSRPSNVPSMAGGVSGYAASSSQRPESQTHTAYVSASSNGQPTKPGKHSSQSNVPLYAAGVAGTAGAVAAAYQSHHHSTAQNSFSGSYPSGSIAQRHRHRGPLSKLVDFWKDPDGVAEFEEYTEYIGVCKYCFPPGSSPRDAPRKHHYRRRGSNERYGSSTRIDKESRYWSSDGESRRKNGKSWLATGMAGYGLAKVGQSLFNQKGNFDGTYSVRSGRANNSNWSLPGRTSQYSPDRRSYISRGATHRSFDTTSRRRSRSRDRVETGITSDGKVYKKDPHGGFLGGPATTTYRTRRRRSRSRSWSRDRRSGLAGAALGAAIGSSMATSTVRHRSRSPKKEFIRTRRRSREQSPSLGFMLGNGGSRNSGNGRHTPSSSYVDIPRSHRKSSSGVFGGFFSSPSEKRRRSRERKQKGFFNFGNSSSSSSSDADLAFGTGIERSRSHRQPKTKWNDRRNTNAGILGLGAAAAALAANEHSKGRQHSRRPDLVAVKEPRSKHGKPSERSHKSKMSSSSSSSEDGGWEDASEDDDSSTVSSGLAYGGPARKSQDSLLSEASGTGKWGWRWGSKKKKKDPIYPLNTAGNGIPLAGAAAVGLAGGVIGAALTSEDRRDGAASSVSSLPSMQHVYPTPTLDPSRFDISRQSSVIASNLPLMTSRPGPIPLQQPQPIAPVPPAVYATQAAYGHSYSAPNGPPVFSQVPLQPQPTVQQARIVESPKMVIPGSFVSPEIGNERLPKEASKEKSHHRRASSPTPRISDTEPSSTSGRKRASTRDQGSGLRFDTSKAQADKEHRDRRRQKEEDDKIRQQSRLREEKERADQEQRDKRRRKDEDDTRRESARLQEAHERAEEERREKRRRKDEENIRRERAQLQEAHERAEEERREKRRKLEEEQFHRERLRLREAEEQAQNDMERRRRSDKPREKVDGRARSEKDLDKETQRLRDQEREPEDSTTSESWVAPVVIGAMGAVVGASIADGATSSTEKRQGMRREERSDSRDGSKISNADDKSSRQRMFSQESDRNADPQGQTVRKVAAKAASSSRHEDYAAYFTPIELLSKSGEQRQAFDINSDNEFTSHQTPHIITIEPTSRKGPLYSPACALKATKDGQDPNRVSLPWSVPRLNLIEPTPPHSTAGSTKGDASPIMRPEDATAADVTEPEKPSTASKVTWGEPETMEYTVITPLESHEEFISYPSMPRSPEEEIAGSRPPTIAHDREERSPIVDASPGHIPGEFGDDLEFAATLAAGLQDTGFDPSIVIDDPTYRRRESPPGSERTVFYERPFAETVTDLGLQFPGTEGAPPQRGFIEGELPSTPKDEQILIGPEGFVDEPEIKLRKNDKKKRDKAAKRQVRDNPSTTASSKSISSSKDEELEEPDRHSREPEPMVSIPSNSFNDLDELADLKKPKSKKSKKDDGRFATTSPGSPLRSEIGGDEYFDVQATIPRFSPISERDARDRDYAASIPLPEVEPDELASSKRSTTEYSHNNLAETKTSNSKKLRRDVEISESPDSGSPKGVALDVTRDDPEEKKDSQSRKSQRESRRHDLDETDVQSNAPFAPEPDEFEKIRKHKRKSKRGSVPDDSLEMDSRSVTASVPGADDFQETRKAKRKSKRESVGYDDAVSAVSAPAAFVDDKESRSKNKKDKKGGLFGLFSSNKSYEDVPEAGKARHAAVETTFDDFEEPKKKSKRKSKDRSSSGDVYDLYGGAAQSVGDLSQIGRSREESDERRSEKTREKEDKRRSRKGSTVEPGITTQDLPSKDENPTGTTEKQQLSKPLDDHAAAVTEIQENVLSFLGVGHDIPPVPDGVEPPLSSQTQDDLSHSAPKPVLQSTTSVAQLPALVPFRPTSPPTSDRAENAAQFIRNRSVSPVSTPDVEKRRLSAWQTSDHIPTPPAVASPTAIPLHFRTPRASVGFTRSSPSSPAVAPESPPSFVHRTRQARPGSTEFKSSTEFRPLWLVERHKSRQDFEPDEPYPSLPSSRTTSRSSSAHDTEGKDTVTLNPDYDTIPNDFGLGINVEHDLNHAEFLDSQQPTPVAISFPSAVQHDADPGDELSRVLDFEHHCDMQTNQPENPIYAPSSSPTPSPAIVDGRLPDHRSASPSRNHAGDFQNLPPLPPSRASSPDGEYDELLSSSAITDAAIAMGGLVGGAAAVVLGHKRNNEKVSSPSRAADDIRSDEGLAAPLDTARRQCMEHKPTTEGDFMQSDKPMEKDNTQSEFSMASASDKGVTTGDELLGPINKSPDAGLLSVEQQRQLQEQDAQDAVDTWFSPATSKTSRKEKKGKKKKASTMAQDLDRSAAETSHTTPSLEITRVAPLTAVEPLIEEYHYPALPEGPTGRRRNQEGQNGTTVLPSKPVITKAEGVDQAVPARQIVEAEDEWHSFSVKSKKSKSKKRKKQDRWDNEPVEPAPADVEQGPETTSTTSCDEPIADLHPAEAPNDLHLAEEPRAFEETDVTPKDDIPTPEPPSSRLEAESVPEPALPVEKAKKDRKKAKEASRPGPFMEVAEEQTSSALEADSEEDPSPSTQSGGNEIEIGPALPKHTHVADVSSIVGSITECVMQGKRKGKGKMRQKLDLWNEPEPMSMDMDPTTVETSERQPEPEPPSMDPVHLTEAEFSQEPEPASSDLGHTIAENTVQKLKPVSSLEPALEAVAAFEAFVPAAEQKSVPELESETDLSFPPKKKKSKKGKKTMQLHEVSSLAPAKPIEDMRQAKASDDKQQEVPSPNSAYPLPETPGAFPVEQNLRTIPSPDTIPLPKDADLGLYHPSDDDQLQKEANFVDTMHSLRAENNDDLRQENTLPTSAALVTEPSGAFSTEQSLSRSPSPETVPLREDSDLDLHAPSNDDQLQQEAIASGGKLDGTLPSSESPSEERMQHETGVLPSLKNIISGVLAPVQKEQHPLRPPSPDRIPLPQDSHLDLDDSLNDDQLRHNVTDSDSNLDVAVPSIESVGEGGMQQGTTIIPTSIDPESEFSESVRTEQNLARTPSPVLIPLPDDVDPEAPSTHLIPLPENAESEFPSPERVPLPEDVDLDIKLPKSAPLADDANLKSSPPEVIRVADDADLALHELLPNTVPLPIEHDRDLRQGSTTTVRESAPSTLGRSQPLMEKATHGPDHSPTSPSHMEDKMKDKLSIPTVPVLSYELPEDHLPLDAAVAESTAVASAEDTDGYLGFSTSGKGPEGTTRERSERSEPSTPNIEPDLQEFKSSDVTTEAHERTTSAIPHQDTLSEPPEDAAIGDMDASAKKKGKKAKKQKLPLPYLEGVLPMLRGSRGTSSTHEIDLQAPLKDTLVESSEPSSTSTSLHPANEQQHPQEADVIAQSKEQNELEMPTFTKRGKKKRKNEKEPFSPEVQTTLSTPGSLNIPSSTPGDFVGSTIGVPEATEASQPSGIISREVQSYPSTPLEGPSDKLGHAIQDFFSISTKKKGKNGKKNKQSQDDDSGSATPERPMAPAQSEPLLAEKDDIVKGEEEIKVKEFKRDKKDKKKGKSDTTAGPKDLAAFVVNEDGAATPPSIPMEGPATAEDQQPTTAIERHESLPDIRPGPSFRDDFLETSSVSHFEGTIVPDGLGETDIIDESHPNTSNEDHLREAIEFSLPLDDPADFPVEVQEEVQEVEPEVDNQEQFFSLKKSKKEKKKAKKAKVAIQEDVPFTTLERSAADIRSKPFDVQTESLEGTYDESPLTLSAEERVQVPEPPSVLDRPFDEPHVSKSSKENATAAVEAEESLLAPAEVDNGIDLNLSPVVKLDASGKGQPRMLEEPAFMETTGEQPSEDLIEPYNAHPPLSDDTRGSFTFQPSLDANTEEVGEGLTAVNKGDVVVNAESPVFNEEPTAVNEMPAASNKNPTVVDEELTEVEDGTVAVAEEPVTVRGQETAGPGNSQAEENLWGIPTRKEARKSKKQQKEILLPSLAKKPRETASNVREQYDGPSTLIVPARDAEASNKMDLGEATSRGTSTEDSEVKGTKAQDPERDDWLEASKIEGNGYEETLSRSLAEPTQLEDINDIKNLGGPDSWKPSLEHRPTMQAEGRDSQQDEWLEGFTSKKKGKKGKNQRHDGHFPLETDVKGDYGAEVLTAAANPRADPGESTERPVSKDLRAPMPTGDAMVPLGGSPFESVVEDSIKPPQSDDFWSSTLAKKGKKGKKSKKQQPAVEWEDETVGSRAGMFAEVTAGRYEPPEVRVLQDKTITSIEESASPGQALQDTPGMAPINPTDEIERASKEAGSDSVWGLAPTKKGKKGKESSKQSRSLEEVATPTSSKYSDGSPGHANLARDVAEQDTIGLRQSKDRRSADEVMVEDLPALPPSRPESPVVRLAERVQPKDERPKNETTLEHLAALPPSRPDFPGVGPGPAEALTQTSTKDGHLREETVLEDLAAIPASRSNSPIARPSRVLAQTQIRDERSKDKILFEDLPTLPPSKPASPVVRPVEAVAQTQTRDGGSKDETMVEEMPPLPPTRLESPLVRPTGTLTQTRSKDGRPKITTRLQDLSAFQSSNPQLPVAGPAERVQSKDEHSQDWIKLEVVPALPPSRPDSPVARSAEALALVQEDVISANPNEHLTRDEVMVESLHGQDRSKTEGAEAYLLTQASTPGEDPYNIRAFKAPTALAAGLGLAVAETLQRQTTKQDSKKGAKKKKKQKKNFDWTEHEEEEPTQLTVMNADQIVEPPRDRSGSPSNFSDFHTLETEQLRQVQVGSEYPSDLATPMVSRSDHFPEQGVSTLPHLNRDSAVHVSDSPLLLQTLPGYNPGRDSGYQDTMASPVVHSKQNSSAASEVQSPLGDDFERFTSQKPLLTKPASVPGPMPRSNDHPASIDSRQQADANTGSSHPLKVSVELDPAYELSVSRHRTRKPGSPMGSGRSVDIHWEQPGSPNEPSEPSGLEHLIDHSRNLNSVPRSREDLRQPPPVESATKDRSSVLFHSSPSTREETTYHPAVHPTREYLHEPKLQESQIAHVEAAESTARGLESSGLRQASHDLPSPTTIATERASSLAALSGTLDIHQAPHLSLFGGPVGTNSDSPSVKSPPPASLSFTGSERRPLDTITEYSPEESPLNKKNRAFSDVGSPERRIRSVYRSVTPQSLGPNHLRSPAVQTSGLGSTPHSRTSAAEKSPISTDDFIARLSWPAVDEDNHSVDLERVLSRNTDRRPSSRHSNSSTRLREGDVRSTSGQSFRSGGSINRFRTPDRDHVRPASGVGNRSATATPPLRRVDRSLSGDLRAANKRSEAKSLAKQPDLGFDPHVPSSSTYDPIKDKGKSIARDDMTDVYEGWGDVHGSPLSPTRPQSMRRRQSLQMIDLETKLDQLASENRLLQDAKSKAERGLEELNYVQNRNENAAKEALETRDLQLHEKDVEIVELRQTLEWVQKKVARLTEVNEGLVATNLSLSSSQDHRYSQLQAEHANAQQQWQQSTRELDDLRQQHVQLSTGMEDIVRHEISIALEDKNAELRRLCDELEVAKEQIRALQQQILASKPSDDLLISRDEDYFDSQCQLLCQHVQQWVLRFSKFSDMKACRFASEVADEKITDRFDNAILDGSDVDSCLADRVKRRDVFMSVVMTMVWEFIFTRYLFGMDREQRQKLKSLEKILGEVGPMKAVHRWRATTLMLLSKREAFQAQRAQDTEAVVQEIYHTLSVFLPPPIHLVKQIQESLRNVMRSAVDLSIEMRTQRAEYIMLPPLQPEYDTNGDLARKVYFNAALMNERSGDTSSNEELEAQHAVVRMVLFPLVVKKGDESGVGDEEIVVCPAQVLVAKPGKEKKVVRVLSGDRMSVDQPNKSVQSFAPSSMDMGNMI